MTADRSLLDALPDALLRVDRADGRILEANARACHLLGYSREALQALQIQALEEDAEAEAWTSQLAGHSADMPRETRLCRGDGRAQPVEITTADADPSASSSVWVAIRSTGERAVDKALRAREQALASIFHTLPIGIGVTRERVLQEVNDGLCTLLGYPRDELVGQSARIIYPDDGEFERVGREKYARIRETGHGEVETRFRCKDGRVIEVLLGSNLLDKDAPSVGVTFTVTDISARKAAERQARESEALFTRFFHAAGTILTISTLTDGCYEHVNDAFVAATGYTRDEAIGVRSVELGILSGAQRQHLLDGIDAHGRIHTRELRLTRKDGGLLDCLYNGEVIETGGQQKLLSILIDITERKRARREIDTERARAEQYLEVARVMLLALDREGRVTLINPKGCEVIGRPAPEILGRPWIDTFIPNAEAQQVRAIFTRLLSGETEGIENVEAPLENAQGHERLIAWHNSVLRDANDAIVGTLSSGEDVTEQRAAERALREERSFLEQIMDGIEDLILVVDRHHRILRMNQAARAKVAQKDGLETDCHCHELLFQSSQPCRADERTCALDQVITTGQSCQLLQQLIDAEGREHTFEVSASPLRDEHGEVIAIIEVVRDMTEHRTLMERLRLQDLRHAHLAHYDPLTDLPNRLLFSDRLQQAIQVAQRAQSKLAVLLLDLDQFKQVNDSFDHSHGDAVLVVLARRLQQCLRGADTIARMGGDEFSIILNELEHDEDAARVARVLLNLFKQPFEIRDHRIFLGASIGISLYPEHGSNAEDLVRNADAALFRAKAEGRNSFQYYAQELTTKAFERILLESSLHDAIANQELVLHYQPLLHLGSKRVCGVEALLRWQHPSMGLVSPDRFIPLAETTGLIVEMGAWVLREACQQMRSWCAAGLLPADALMCVNLSARQLRHEDLVDEVQRALATSRLPAPNLELEITETSVMASAEESARRLGQLRALGVKLAVDDFGTGYSSLAYLKRLPLTKLKIDRSFVSDIPGDTNDMAITRAIIALAKTLGLDVLAEGIETQSQLDFLVQEACDRGQGYLFSRPLAAVDLTSYLTDIAGESSVDNA